MQHANEMIKMENQMTADTLLPYIDLNQETELPFIKELSRPLHSRDIVNSCRGLKLNEALLSEGVNFDLKCSMSPPLRTALSDFRRFFTKCLKVRESDVEGAFQVSIELDDSVGPNESFTVDVFYSYCEIRGSGVDGIRRALIYLEDEISLRRYPALKVGRVERRPVVKTRISRSPFASYRFGTGWELDKVEDAYPKEYLNRLAHCGVNGIWVAGLFRELIHSKILPEITVDDTKLQLLKKLVRKAGLYGIKVYLFVIEPRIQDDRDPVFQTHPEIRGSKWGNYGRTLCTSHPLVLQYIEDATAELFRKAPGLGGLINLFRGERTTACCSPPPPVSGTNDPKRPGGGRPADYVKPCPRCAERKMEDVYCDELDAFYKGMRLVSPDAELIAWNYGHNQMDLNKKILKNLNPDIHFLDTFEHDGKKEICGKTRIIDEYSISYVGPSESFKKLNSSAKKQEKSLYAKIQLGATYEAASMPYVPVPTSPYRKFKRMRELGVEGVMQSWIVGGFPSIMHKAAGEAAFSPLDDEDEFLKRLAAIEWGEDNAERVAEAWRLFNSAYYLYPFSSPVFYFGPITKSPAYHLYLEPQGNIAKPYNWGIGRDRVIQPYEDDLDKWLGPFTPNEIIKSFHIMAMLWERGLCELRAAAANLAEKSPQVKQLAVAQAIAIQFLSCANVYEFYKLRDELPDLKARAKKKAYEKMESVALSDIKLAAIMKPLIKIEPSIGFQAEMRYYSFSENLIDAKIAQVTEMLVDLRKKMKKN